jgi:hypothetical protein
MTFTRHICALIIFIFCNNTVKSQNAPVGYWESHLPYNSPVGMCTDGKTLYTICTQAFFTINNNENPVPYSKVEGMSDIGMQCTGYDAATSTVILVYSDGNIDLLKNNTFYNIPDIKLKAASAAKIIYQVYADNGIAYLSTTFGIVIIDLARQLIMNTLELTESNVFGNNITVTFTSFIRSGNYFYAASNYGVFRVEKKNPQIQNFQAWELIDETKNITNIAGVNNELFFSSVNAVYEMTAADSLHTVYLSHNFIRHIDAGNNNLLVCEYVDSSNSGSLKVVSTDGRLTDSLNFAGKPLQAAQLSDNSLWIADSLNGLRKRTGPNETDFHIPDGPASVYSYDIYAYNRDLYIAHGGYDGRFFAFQYHTGFSYLHNDKWTHYNDINYPKIGSTRDFVSLAKDESNGILYAGSYLDGLLILQPGDNIRILNRDTIFDGSYSYGADCHQIVGMTMDAKSNLWLTLMYARDQLYVKTKDNDWYKFSLPNIYYGGPVVVDDQGQVYFASLSGGVAVYNTNNTLGDISDDASYHITTGISKGNLPGNGVLCIAKDNNNEIWIGTDNGIAILNSCKAPFTQSAPCDAVIPAVPYAPYPGTLFAGSNINTIAVDGANRKWVGTDDGAWLLSPDAQQVISRFTIDNSPLPSNNIQKIAIDNATGDVYFGTYQGLVSYHGTATVGTSSYKDVAIFPNPVPAGYNGTIAIKGLLVDSDVRITDMNGQLVYQTKVTSGEAIWDGRDYSGHRPQSGIYLVFISSGDRKHTYAGKIAFVQ